MPLTVAEVEHVAALAKLTLSEAEKTYYAEQLNSILAYAERLNELDTDGVMPLTHILPLENVVRPDQVIPGPGADAVMQNAPQVVGSLYKVAKIL